MLVVIVGPPNPVCAAEARALGHAVVEAAIPAEVPLDLAPEHLVCPAGEDPAPWLSRLGPTPTSQHPPPSSSGRLLPLTAVHVDLRGRRVFRLDGAWEPLLDKEAALLAALAARPDRVHTRGDLLAEVWGYAPTMLTRTVDNTVRRLRTRIEADPASPDHVLTVRGEGYRFAPLPSTSTSGAATAPSGELRLGCTRDRGVFALYAWGASMWTMVREAVVEPLVTLDREGRPLPGPLEAIDVAPDGLSAVLTLRPGLTFHPHPALPPAAATAEDLHASLVHALRAGRVSLPVAPSAPDVVGPRALRLRFTTPVGPLVQRLEGALLVPAALERVDDLADLLHPVGTGPFRFPDVAQDPDGLELVAHLDHWRRVAGAPVPGVARIRVSGVYGHTVDDMLARVVSGDLDFAPFTLQVSRDEILARPSAGAVRVIHRASRYAITCLVWFRDGPAGLDVAGRRALHRALDRRPLVAGEGAHATPSDRFLPEFALGYEIDRSTPPPEPMPTLSRPLVIGVHPARVALGAALLAQLEALGVPARIAPMGTAASAEQFAAPTIDGSVLSTQCRFWGADPQPHLEALVRPFVEAGTLGPEALALFDALAATARRGERVVRIRALVAHLHDRVPVMPLVWDREGHPPCLVSRRIHGFDDPALGLELPTSLPPWSQITVDG